MQLNHIKSNMNEVIIGDVTILFSYKTPVAFHQAGVGYTRTGKYYSRTTSGHINYWLRMNGASMDTVSMTNAFDIALHGALTS